MDEIQEFVRTCSPNDQNTDMVNNEDCRWTHFKDHRQHQARKQVNSALLSTLFSTQYVPRRNVLKSLLQAHLFLFGRKDGRRRSTSVARSQCSRQNFTVPLPALFIATQIQTSNTLIHHLRSSSPATNTSPAIKELAQLKTAIGNRFTEFIPKLTDLSTLTHLNSFQFCRGC